MKTKLFAILILTGCFLFMNPKTVLAQYNFDDVVDEAVFSWGESGDWDDGLVWFPSVIKDGDTLRMWYTGGDEIVWFGPVYKIGYAWSLDGIEWNRYSDNPVLEADLPWEGSHLFGCSVIKDGNMFKMWYGATPNTLSPGQIIGYATSADGKTWVKNPMPVLELGQSLEWDDSHMTPMTVFKDNGEYKLYYWAGRYGFPWSLESLPQCGLATSADGINWTKYDDPTTTEPPYAFSDPVLKVGGLDSWDEHRAMCPMVIKQESGYEMLYIGVSGTVWGYGHAPGFAKSDDGINWEKYPLPVLSDPRDWGNTNYGGSLLFFDNKYHLWYALFHSNDGMADPQIGYATATTPQQMVGDIIAKVEALEDAGVLNKGQANALIKKLESAIKSIDQENYNAAINKLNAFINQVNAFMNGGILTTEQGNDLITDAQAIIDILENMLGYKSGETQLLTDGDATGNLLLEQNYPNPFSGITTISFRLTESSETTVKVYNSVGQEVAVLFSGMANANEKYDVEFNARDLPKGIYLYSLQSGQKINVTKKMLLLEH